MFQQEIFSLKEIRDIMKQFFSSKFNLKHVYSHFENKYNIQIKSLIIQQVQEVILSIESELYKKNKIEKLKIYDNQSSSMFEELINLKDILPIGYDEDFYLHFLNGKSDDLRTQLRNIAYHHPIFYDYKEQIYGAFIKYIEKHNLYRFAIRSKERSLNTQTPYEEPSRVFSIRSLDLVYRLFCQTEGNARLMSMIMKEKKFEQDQYELEILIQKLQNLQLIGLYNVYKGCKKSSKSQGLSWIRFKDYYQIDKGWEFKIVKKLMRIGIRNNATPEELKDLGQILGQRCCWAEDSRFEKFEKKKISSKIKEEMLKIIQGT